MQWAYHLVLPWATFAILFAALYVRMIRANVMEALGEDYVRTARAKGAPEWLVMRSHVLRNALLPGRDDARHGHRHRARRRDLHGIRLRAARSRQDRSSTRSSAFDLPTIAGGRGLRHASASSVFNLIVDCSLYALHRSRIRLGQPGDPSDGASRGQRPEDVLQDGRRCRPGGRRRLVHRRQGPDARHRRRVWLGQERHVPDDHGPEPEADGDLDRHRALEGRGPADREPAPAARDPRQRDRDDLPGSDDEPQPGAQDRGPARRGDASARRRLEEAVARACGSSC